MERCETRCETWREHGVSHLPRRHAGDSPRLTSDHNKQTRITSHRKFGGAEPAAHENVDRVERILEHESRAQRDTGRGEHAELVPHGRGPVHTRQAVEPALGAGGTCAAREDGLLRALGVVVVVAACARISRSRDPSGRGGQEGRPLGRGA